MSGGSFSNPLFVARNVQKGTKLASKSTDIYSHPNFCSVIEIIKDRFYFATLAPGKKDPRSLPNAYLFDIDNELVYNNFYNDFGPLNIAALYKYCLGVSRILKNTKRRQERIIHFTSSNPNQRANAAYLAASYSVLYLNKSPCEVYHKFTIAEAPPLKPFQDASIGVSIYKIQLIDCLNALNKASSLGFFDFEDFDVHEYELYENIRNGDLNWIVPRKFLAFLGPNTESSSRLLYPENYLNYFMKNEVVAVIRLNRKTYESFRFTNAGILHYDLFFPDGRVPSRKLLKQFLQIAETTKGAIAVHCKAGLGRTGTLIAAYIMKHYRMSAREAIAWLRICRPGSVIGHQQTWLEEMEKTLWREGALYRIKYHGDEDLILHHRRGIYSIAAKLKKDRYQDYLSKEKIGRTSSGINVRKRNSLVASNSGCSSFEINARCDFLNTLMKKPLAERTETNNNSTITQGDKLNEIKMRRKELNNEQKTPYKSTFLNFRNFS